MATKTKTSFDVLCPDCGNEDGAVRLDLNTMECQCSECEWEGTPQEAAAKVMAKAQKWAAVVRWIELAPQAMAS